MTGRSRGVAGAGTSEVLDLVHFFAAPLSAVALVRAVCPRCGTLVARLMGDPETGRLGVSWAVVRERGPVPAVEWSERWSGPIPVNGTTFPGALPETLPAGCPEHDLVPLTLSALVAARDTGKIRARLDDTRVV